MNPWHTIEVWLIALLVTVALLAGFGMFTRWCSFSPAVRRDKLSKLHIGMKTDEVVALFGTPRQVRHSATGLRQWVYGSRMKRHVLMIEFSAQDTLQSFAHGVPDPRRAARNGAA